MPEWDCELYKLIDEPCGVEYSFVLRHRDEIIVLRVVFSKLRHKVVVAGDRLVHIVQATVTLNSDGAFGVEVQVKDIGIAVNDDITDKIAVLNAITGNSLEETVVDIEVDVSDTLFQCLQINLKLL